MRNVVLHGPGEAIEVPNIAVGCMRINELDDAGRRAFVDSALESGLTFFDHADIYGGARHLCEELFGAVGVEREAVQLQTKTGIRPGFYDSSYEHIVRSVEESLVALRTDYVDVLLIHRPDVLADADEIERAFEDLYAGGKVRAFGVSNHNARQMRSLASKWVAANQVQFSLAHPALVAAHLTVNMLSTELSPSRDAGLLGAAREDGVVLQAYSPYMDTKRWRTFMGDQENWGKLNEVIERLAGEYGVAPEAIPAAWILRVGGTQVVTGTTKGERLARIAAASDLELSREHFYELYRAAGHVLP
ncbi:aldo/keto reductase [Buchananella felis]|uniref:aldo/keto reductase n=1 Tax=Buchananella felis TaxID=3231492 RepID=UPI003529C801